MDDRGVSFSLVHRARRRTCPGGVTSAGHDGAPYPQWKGATRRVHQDEQDEGIITSDYGGGVAGRR
jgi:hypothetical protein